jgi:hypothetical protein
VDGQRCVTIAKRAEILWWPLANRSQTTLEGVPYKLEDSNARSPKESLPWRFCIDVDELMRRVGHVYGEPALISDFTAFFHEELVASIFEHNRRVTKSSGKSFTHRLRYACAKFLRQSFHEFAAASIPHCAWAKAFYNSQRARNKGHHTAVRALAYKWIRILYACWKSRTPYNESLYLQSLKNRLAPIAKCL